MEIKLNSDLNAVTRTRGLTPKVAKAAAEGAPASFEASEGLNQALAANPEVRPDEVARARALIASEQYPPDVMVERIARLLALHWGQSE
jgi:hypothetical protein